MSMFSRLIGLWHFDETQGGPALSQVAGAGAIQIYGGQRLPRGFGKALHFKTQGDFARGPSLGKLVSGTICFWLSCNAPTQALDILKIQNTLQVIVDPTIKSGWVVTFGECVLMPQTKMPMGQWVHVAITFSLDGLYLYLDGKAVAEGPPVKAGLTAGLLRHAFLELGPVAASKTSFAIDELAIFSFDLAPEMIQQLLLGGIEHVGMKQTYLAPKHLNAADYFEADDPTCGLQKAIDALGPSGGVVDIPAGRYPIRQAIHLCSQTTLRAVDGRAVLLVDQTMATRLLFDARAGQDTIQVDDVSIFRIGDAVMVRDRQLDDWQATHAVVTELGEQQIGLSRSLEHGVSSNDQAFACHWFPAIIAVRQHQVAIEGIAIECTPTPLGEQWLTHDQVCAAICLIDCVEVAVEKCHVKGWLHDGIAVHGGHHIDVKNCTTQNCFGHGFYVGHHAFATRWCSNRASHHGQDGFHFGAGVHDTQVTHSFFESNAKHGIGRLGDLEEHANIVMANHCNLNAQAGISLVGGGGNTLTQNICRDNSSEKKGCYAGIVISESSYNLIQGNQCFNTQEIKTQTVGLLEAADAHANVIVANVCVDCLLQQNGRDSVCQNNLQKKATPKRRRAFLSFDDD